MKNRFIFIYFLICLFFINLNISFADSNIINIKKNKYVSNTVYYSYVLNYLDTLFSQETVDTELKKLIDLYKLSSNPFDSVFYLKQVVLLSYKYGRYGIAKTYLEMIISEIGKDPALSKYGDYLNRLVERLTVLYNNESKTLKSSVKDLSNKELKKVYYELFRTIGEEGFENLFFMYLYTFQFDKCQILLNNIYPSYFRKRNRYYNLQNILDRYVVLFGDIYIPSMDFYSLINTNFVNINRQIDLSQNTVKLIAMYKSNIKQAREYYQQQFINRLKIMEQLLPYLHVLGLDKDFKNLYMKVTVLRRGRIPTNLDLKNINYSYAQLRKIYREALGNTITALLYELYNNIDLHKAEQMIKEIKSFNPKRYIGNNKTISYGISSYN
ncbi:hypothetical protein DEFDS_P230 (plasmid) [Deferribacter desulfuricans SSM1]|uniref:Uncharacterized protein n=1 Tax=Deferribacter desulfuricans (strain DSM 14783 / JCM 11476 / NBRC 101012 / SSM1) TaxID=639282 RepID=D3PF58_DEFDS|nr:hypothetical protein [Deferribacter desulfuricans]BAI81850.1 hypothetical protein DEFDS_P230 [Deferribacter desulfuricans SSM1]